MGLAYVIAVRKHLPHAALVNEKIDTLRRALQKKKRMSWGDRPSKAPATCSRGEKKTSPESLRIRSAAYARDQAMCSMISFCGKRTFAKAAYLSDSAR